MPNVWSVDGERIVTRKVFGTRVRAFWQHGVVVVENPDPMSADLILRSEEKLDALLATIVSVGEHFADDWYVEATGAIGVEITVYDRSQTDFESITVEYAIDPYEHWEIAHWRSTPTEPDQIHLGHAVVDPTADITAIYEAVDAFLRKES